MNVNQISSSPEFKKLDPAYRILVAEDNDDLRQILADVINLIGIQSQFAINGKQAFDIIQSQAPGHFDAILSDISMPEMDGFEFLIKLRQNSFNQPFIFMTAAPTVENVSRAALLGITHILEKPFDVEELRRCLIRVLENNLPENE